MRSSRCTSAITIALTSFLTACSSGSDDEPVTTSSGGATDETVTTSSGGATDETVTTSSGGRADNEVTITIDGKEYTCAEITGSEPAACGEGTQVAFEKYGENLGSYVNSGQLGPLNEGPFEDAAFAGLVACATMMQGDDQEAYLDYMMEDQTMASYAADEGGVAFFPAYFEASSSLCPNMNPGSEPLP